MLQIGNDKAYNTKELASLLGYTPHYVRSLINDGYMQAQMIGKEKYVTAPELKKYLETVKPQKEG